MSLAALGAVAAAVVLLGNTWWVLVVAAVLAFVLTQLGFIGHDAGHRQICVHRRGNDLIGLLVANLFVGFSFGWWLTKHNRHHAHTNRPDKDPDLVPGALVYTPDQARGRGRFGRRFARSQMLLLLPLLFLEALNLHVASAISLARRRDRAVAGEVGLLTVHALLFFVAPFLVLSPLRAVGFILVTQALFGFYLGVSFITNHVGMPTLSGTDELGFLRRQVLTSRNLTGPLVHRLPLRRARHPDRAPPLPVHAPGQPAPGPGRGAPLLRRAPDRLRRAESLAGLPGGAPSSPTGRYRRPISVID